MEVNNSVLASLSTPPCVHEWQYDGSQYITCNQNAKTQSMMMMMMMMMMCARACTRTHACVFGYNSVIFSLFHKRTSPNSD